MIRRAIPTSRNTRRLLGAAALTGLAATAVVLALTGSFGPAEYGTTGRRITVEAGEQFTLAVPARPYMGEHWYLADPRPDARVLVYDGTREEIEGTDEDIVGGGDGTAYFDFTARAGGTTTVTLLHCPLARCGGAAEARASAAPVPTAAATQEPGDEPAFFRYEITVR
ncbi:protease inhibitor I42 family protein [Streptomyces lavendofoliae]|uniref:protease inhibitor I42 family protein n=1 Tax=Streptomyces lavendofoliae TaxID=67314 RepID=UPI00300EEA4B